MKSIPRRKVSVIGDKDVGKTCLLLRFCTGQFPSRFLGSLIENRIEEVEVDGKQVQLHLWEMVSGEGYDHLRPLSYPDTNIFLICFSVDSSESFDNVQTKWLPELLHFRPHQKVSYILVGCKRDLRTRQATIDAFRESGREFVALEKGEAMAQDIGAVMYIECSALTGGGVTELFESAARESLRSSFRTKRGVCIAF